MTDNSFTCPNCGRLVQSDVGVETVCECGECFRGISGSGAPHTSGTEVFLLGCPNCGSQRQARGEWIGRTEACDCGQKYRFTLSLAKVPAEPDGVIAQGILDAKRCWNSMVKFWRRQIEPRLKHAWVFTCEHIVPWIVSSVTAACSWTLKAFHSALNPGPLSRPDFPKTYKESAHPDWEEVLVPPERTKGTLTPNPSPPIPTADSTSDASPRESSNAQ